jgi:hypothetical protein
MSIFLSSLIDFIILELERRTSAMAESADPGREPFETCGAISVGGFPPVDKEVVSFTVVPLRDAVAFVSRLNLWLDRWPLLLRLSSFFSLFLSCLLHSSLILSGHGHHDKFWCLLITVERNMTSS